MRTLCHGILSFIEIQALMWQIDTATIVFLHTCFFIFSNDTVCVVNWMKAKDICFASVELVRNTNSS